MIDALIFDFDGVIIDTGTPDYQTWREVFNSHGVDLERAIWSRLIGSEMFDVFQHLVDLAGVALDREEVLRSRRKRYRTIVQASPLLPGIHDHIAEAGRLGLKLGVASSSDRAWVEGHLADRELLANFQCVVTKDDVKNIKPDPELYLLATRRLGTSPDRAVAVEDSYHGVTAAKRAGLYCVTVPNSMTNDMPLEQADLRLEALSDMGLRELLETLVSAGPSRTVA